MTYKGIAEWLAITLTAALAELNVANDAVEAFLEELDLDGDGEADNAGVAAANRAELTVGGAGAYDDALEAVGDLVDAATGLVAGTPSNWVGLTDAQRAAELSKAKVNLAAEVTNAQTDVDTAYAAMSAALKTAITSYEAAVAAQEAADAAEQKTDADLTAAIAKYNIDVGAVDITFSTAGDSNAALTTAFDSLITIDGAKYTAALAAGVTETTNPGITAVLSALQADLAAEKALAAADTALGTAETALDTADGGIDDATEDGDGDLTAGEAGDDNGTFLLAEDAATYNAYKALVTALETAQDNVTALNDAVADLDAIEEQVAALEALDDAVTAADSAIGAAGYDLNNANGSLDLNGDLDFTDEGEYDFTGGTDADETELYTADYAGGAITMGEGDVISVAGFTFNDGASATAGNNNVLEFFVEEVGANLVVTFETVAFGSNATNNLIDGEIVQLTLTGLALEDVGLYAVSSGN